jgi:hypothetical protein
MWFSLIKSSRPNWFSLLKESKLQWSNLMSEGDMVRELGDKFTPREISGVWDMSAIPGAEYFIAWDAEDPENLKFAGYTGFNTTKNNIIFSAGMNIEPEYRGKDGPLGHLFNLLWDKKHEYMDEHFSDRWFVSHASPGKKSLFDESEAVLEYINRAEYSGYIIYGSSSKTPVTMISLEEDIPADIIQSGINYGIKTGKPFILRPPKGDIPELTQEEKEAGWQRMAIEKDTGEEMGDIMKPRGPRPGKPEGDEDFTFEDYLAHRELEEE